MTILYKKVLMNISDDSNKCSCLANKQKKDKKEINQSFISKLNYVPSPTCCAVDHSCICQYGQGYEKYCLSKIHKCLCLYPSNSSLCRSKDHSCICARGLDYSTYCLGKTHNCICTKNNRYHQEFTSKCIGSDHQCICLANYNTNIKCLGEKHECKCVMYNHYAKYYPQHQPYFPDNRNKTIDTCISDGHVCVCKDYQVKFCRTNSHKCQCASKEYRFQLDYSCANKRFNVPVHNCYCGYKPVCFAEKHKCICNSTQTTNKFRKYLKKNNIKLKCLTKDKMRDKIHILLDCTNNYLPNELIDLILSYLHCE